MNKQEFEQRFADSSNPVEMAVILEKRIKSIIEEISPANPSMTCEIAVRAAACKMLYESLYNTLPPSFKGLCDNLVNSSTIIAFSRSVKRRETE